MEVLVNHEEQRGINISAQELLNILTLFKNGRINRMFPQSEFEFALEEDSTASAVSVFKKEDGMRWLYFKLRDRSSDGPSWNETPLTTWPYKHQDDCFNLGKAVEQSRYWGHPKKPLTDVFEPELATFIINPFDALPYNNPTRDNLETWLEEWLSVYHNPQSPFPGQFSLAKIPGLANYMLEATKVLLQQKGYDYLTSVPTWLHVALLNKSYGFKFMYPQDEKRVYQLLKKLPHRTVKERKEASWITMLQFWAQLAENVGLNPESIIDDPSFILRDEDGKILTYPLTPNRNLWQILKVV